MTMKKFIWIFAAFILIAFALFAFRTFALEKTEADNHLKQGIEQFHKSDYSNSLASLNRSLILFEKVRDKKGQANASLQLALYYLETLDPDRAADYAGKSLELFNKTSDKNGAFRANVILADALLQKKEIDRASKKIDNAWNQREKDLPANLLTEFHLVRGRIESRKRKAELAFKDFNEAYTLSEKENEENLQFIALNELSLFFMRAGDSASARKYYQMSQKVPVIASRQYFRAMGEETEGWIFQCENKKEETRKAWEKSLDSYKSIGNRGKEAETLLNLAWISSGMQEQDKAREYIINALNLSKSIDNRHLRMLSAWYLKNFITMTRNPDDLSLVIAEYEDIAQTCKDPSDKAKAYYHLGELLHYMKGDLKESESAYSNAEKFYGDAGEKKWQVTTLLNISVLQAKQGKLDESLKTCQKALVLRQEMGEVRKEDDPAFHRSGSIGEIYRRMAHACRSRGNYEKALEFYGKALDYDKANNLTTDKINDLNFIFDTSLEASDNDRAWKALAEFLEEVSRLEDPAERVNFYRRIFRALTKTDPDGEAKSSAKTEEELKRFIMQKLQGKKRD